MSTEEQAAAYIASQLEPKRSEMQELHGLIQRALPGSKLWFDNGKNSEGKTVSNPTIGYGMQTIKYVDGKTKDFFRIGLSGNTSGISVYILGIEDKAYLQKTYGERIGKASVTGYCIKFRKLRDIDLTVLEEAIKEGN